MLANPTMPQSKYDLAVVGHIVLDYISRGSEHYATQMGSPCVYASLGARALNVSVVVGSKVGYDFGKEKLAWLSSRGVEIKYVRHSNSPTTSFRIRYTNGSRSMWVASKCASLTSRELSDLPVSSALHLGPILDEVPQTLAISLADPSHVTCLDPQGYLRRVLRDGAIRGSKWRNRVLLRHLDVLKVSEDESYALIGRTSSSLKLRALGPGIVLITRGRAGTIVWSRDHGMYMIPAYKTRVRDPTGAGDALVGAFLVTWVHTGDLTWSAAVGSAVASFVVEKVGPANFGTPKQVEKRAKTVLEGIVRMHG